MGARNWRVIATTRGMKYILVGAGTVEMGGPEVHCRHFISMRVRSLVNCLTIQGGVP